MSSSKFVSGRGCTFIIDGPEVEILQESRPIARIPLVDLMEFFASQPLRSSDTKSKLVAALEVARHELTTLHGLMAFDGAAAAETWPIDTSNAIKLIDDALSNLHE